MGHGAPSASPAPSARRSRRCGYGRAVRSSRDAARRQGAAWGERLAWAAWKKKLCKPRFIRPLRKSRQYRDAVFFAKSGAVCRTQNRLTQTEAEKFKSFGLPGRYDRIG